MCDNKISMPIIIKIDGVEINISRVLLSVHPIQLILQAQSKYINFIFYNYRMLTICVMWILKTGKNCCWTSKAIQTVLENADKE